MPAFGNAARIDLNAGTAHIGSPGCSARKTAMLLLSSLIKDAKLPGLLIRSPAGYVRGRRSANDLDQRRTEPGKTIVLIRRLRIFLLNHYRISSRLVDRRHVYSGVVYMKSSRLFLVLVSALVSAGICASASAQETYRKTRCPNPYPGARALAEDLARNIEMNANTDAVIFTEGSVQKKVRLHKVRVTFTRPSIKLFLGTNEVEQPLSLTGEETAGKTILGNHAAFSAPPEGSSEYVVNILPMTDGRNYTCQYKFNARIRASAYREWQEGTTVKSERIRRFRIAGVNDIIKEVPLFAIAKTPGLSGR